MFQENYKVYNGKLALLQFPKNPINNLISNYLFSVPKLIYPNENYLPLLLNFILVFLLDLSSLPL